MVCFSPYLKFGSMSYYNSNLTCFCICAVKFFNGIPGRYARYINSDVDCVSVLLNPTLIDTRPLGSIDNTPSSMSSSGNLDRITLQLRYVNDEVAANESIERYSLPESTGGVLPLADFLVVG